MSDMLNICGFWKRKDKNGKTFLVGRLTRTTTLMFFENSKKSKETDPDMYLCIAKAEERPAPAPEPEATHDSSVQQCSGPQQQKIFEDIPF